MESVIAKYFTHAEIEQLEFGVPRLWEWGDSLLVPFKAYCLRSATVVWMNRRWFLERNINITERATSDRVRNWLLDEFAWHVPFDAPGNEMETRTLWADRYGSSNGLLVHGGSGRVATIGCFQAKGIGQTPLVGHGAAVGHSHGCVSLAECLREAIYAEVAAAEFPHGALPVIAILDTGLFFSSPNIDERYDQNVRRGILIRPAVLRAAHAERAPLFKRSATSGFNVQQCDDVRRTRDMIGKWVTSTDNTSLAREGGVVGDCVYAIAEQIAFGQIHRLFSGGYVSSNVSIRGELLDFGNMHALPNWSKAQFYSSGAGFGNEMQLFTRLIRSLSFYVTKYGVGVANTQLAKRLIELANEAYQRSWRRYALSLFHAQRVDPSIQVSLLGIIHRYFRDQQRVRVRYEFGRPRAPSSLCSGAWLHDALLGESAPQSSLESRTLKDILALLRCSNAGNLYVAISTAARLLMPRRSIDRGRLIDILASAVSQDSALPPDSEAINMIVSDSVSGARRHWHRLPDDMGVLAHATLEGSSALLCSDHAGPPVVAWLEGICGTGCLYWFNLQLRRTEFPAIDLRVDGRYWSALCPVRTVSDGIWHAQLFDREVRLPPMKVWYLPDAGPCLESGATARAFRAYRSRLLANI